jgi:hypothetical protein
MANAIRNKIIEILEKTFAVLDSVYANNDEASSKADFKKAGSRLIFPRYSNKYRGGVRRISEQELRFLFIEQFTQYCQNPNTQWDAYYSIETPTEWKYKFAGEEKPHKTEDGSGQSAMMDVCIHDNCGKRICLIEFKAGNPDEFCYVKDFVKLNAEEGLSFFVQLLESQNKGTMDNIIREKIGSDLGNINYVCHTIASDYHGTEYMSKEEITSVGWKRK